MVSMTYQSGSRMIQNINGARNPEKDGAAGVMVLPRPMLAFSPLGSSTNRF